MVDMKTLTIGGTKFEIVDAEARADISSLQAAVGSPLVASTVSAMTDTSKIYVYTGSESGYTSGDWYYHNGSAWVSGGVYNAVAVDTDDTLTVEGMAADAKKTGDEIADLKSAISGGIGISVDVKESLLTCFRYVAWINDDGQDYYDALEAALYPPADLVSISAVYTQSGTVYDTDTLDSLKTDLVVTAHYDDSTTATVTTYTLSGTLSVGTSTITVSYGGKTTTFTVTVSDSQTINVTYTQGSIGSGNSDANKVSGVIHSAVHFDDDETMVITVAEGYSLYPFGFVCSSNTTLTGTKSSTTNVLYTYAVSDSGYVANGNNDFGNNVLKANDSSLVGSGSAGWKTGTITYSYERVTQYPYSFTGLGFLVKKNDDSNITPSEIEQVITVVKVD